MRTGHRDLRSLKSYQHILRHEGRNEQHGLILGDASGALDGTKNDNDGVYGVQHEGCGHGDETFPHVGGNAVQSTMVNKDEDGNGNDHKRCCKSDTMLMRLQPVCIGASSARVPIMEARMQAV